MLWFLLFGFRLIMCWGYRQAPLSWLLLQCRPGRRCCCCPYLTLARLPCLRLDASWAQAIAAVTSDGRLAVACSREADLWEETALEQDSSTLTDGHAGPNEMDICEDAAPAIHACCAPLPGEAQQLLIR